MRKRRKFDHFRQVDKNIDAKPDYIRWDQKFTDYQKVMTFKTDKSSQTNKHSNQSDFCYVEIEVNIWY